MPRLSDLTTPLNADETLGYNHEESDQPGRVFEIFREGFLSVARAGDMAPDFTLPSLDGDEVSLSSLQGLPVILEFGSCT